MRAVVQRVKKARVSVTKAGGSYEAGSIGRGLVVLVGVEKGDTEKDVEYLARKILGVRIFADDEGRMNLSVKEVSGEVLVVPQFTLIGDLRKGRRPSFDHAEDPATAAPLIEGLIKTIESGGVGVGTGVFQATMEVELVNHGPVTILLDSRKVF